MRSAFLQGRIGVRMPKSKHPNPRRRTALEEFAELSPDSADIEPWWRNPDAVLRRAIWHAGRDPRLKTRLRAHVGRIAAMDEAFRREVLADLVALGGQRGALRKPIWVRALLVSTVKTWRHHPARKFSSVDQVLAHFAEVWRDGGAIPELAVSMAQLKKLYYQASKDPEVVGALEQLREMGISGD